MTAKILRHQLLVTGNYIGLTLVYNRENSTILQNANLEAANTRTRLLIEFIIGRKRQDKRDFQPADLGVLDWHSRNAPRLRCDLTDLDQRSAHLSKVRVENLEGYSWMPDSAFALILEEFSAIAIAVDVAGSNVAAQIIRGAVKGAYYLMENPTCVYPFDLGDLEDT
jgi:hypothetical protein